MKRMALASGFITALCLIPQVIHGQTTPGNIAVITGNICGGIITGVIQ